MLEDSGHVSEFYVGIYVEQGWLCIALVVSEIILLITQGGQHLEI